MNLASGKVKKTLLWFALPLIVSLLCEQLYNIVDTIIVGRFLGVDELSAVGNAGSIIQVLLVICGGMEMGCEIVFAKYAGQWKTNEFIQSVLSILCFCTVCAITLSGMGLLGKELVCHAMNIPEEILPLLYEYYQIYVGCIAVSFLYAVGRAVLLAMGNSKTCMFLVLFTSGLNIVLDLLLICVFTLGVSGAAIATILSQSVGMVAVGFFLIKHTGYHFQVGINATLFMKKMKEVLHIAIPSMVQQFAITFSSLLVMAVVNPFGTQIISGYIASEKIMMFTLIPIVGLSMAISMFASANETQMGRIKEGFAFLNQIMVGYITVVVAIVVFFPQWMVEPFIDVQQNVVAFSFARNYLSCSIVTFYFSSIKYMNEGLLRGFSKMKHFLVSNLSDLFVKVAFAILLVSWLGTQVFWMATLSGRLISVTISLFLLFRMQFFSFQKKE